MDEEKYTYLQLPLHFTFSAQKTDEYRIFKNYEPVK